MSFTFPNETAAYRAQRDELLQMEADLRARSEAVAAARRSLPLGGALKEPYVFSAANGADPGTEVAFGDLFAGHDTLLLYTMMYGEAWDAPCPSCTSIVDGFNSTAHSIEAHCGFAVVAAASQAQLADWAQQRNWQRVALVSAQNSSYVLDYAGFAADDPGLVSVMNVFVRNSDGIFHSWASELLTSPMDNGHPRHVDPIWLLWNLLDLTPKGRGEAAVPKQDFEHRYFSSHVLGEEPS